MNRCRAFGTAAAISLLFCVVSLELWRESYALPFERRLITSNIQFYVFRLGYGIFELDRTDCFSGSLPPQFPERFNIYWLPQGLSLSWNSRCKSALGFGYRNEPLILPMGNNLVTAATRSWSVPIWPFAAATSVLPAIFAFKAHRSRRRRLANSCLRCAYSLTGNTSGVCPECGKPIHSESASEKIC